MLNIYMCPQDLHTAVPVDGVLQHPALKLLWRLDHQEGTVTVERPMVECERVYPPPPRLFFEITGWLHDTEAEVLTEDLNGPNVGWVFYETTSLLSEICPVFGHLVHYKEIRRHDAPLKVEIDFVLDRWESVFLSTLAVIFPKREKKAPSFFSKLAMIFPKRGKRDGSRKI